MMLKLLSFVNHTIAEVMLAKDIGVSSTYIQCTNTTSDNYDLFVLFPYAWSGVE